MRMEATILGATEMEELMTVNYSDAKLAAGSHSRSAYTAPSGIYNLYTVLWDVADNEPLPNTKTINITVCWEKNRHAPADCSLAPQKKSVSLNFIRADL
jgi:hypothetical protein